MLENPCDTLLRMTVAITIKLVSSSSSECRTTGMMCGINGGRILNLMEME